MKMISLEEELKGNAYPGRGIVIGKSQDGKKAVTAYFIMGRSVNSRNRVFTETEDGIRTEAADPSKLTDPHLIIYAPVRVLGNKTIVTNGDQTDTIYELMDKQQTFEQSLRTREYEDDAPNYTPRISGIMHIDKGEFNYAMEIRIAVRDLHSLIQIHFREPDISFTPIWVMAIHFQALRVSRSWLQSRMIWMHLPICCGTL